MTAFEGLDDGGEFDIPAATADMRGRLATAEDCRTFALAGNATLTLVSKASGARFTYKVSKPKERRGAVSHFVSLLNGPNNEGDFKYLGLMRENVAGVRYEHGGKSKVSKDAPSAKAFNWFWGKVIQNDLPEQIEVWHEGRCCRCGRKLTVPESVARGIGPECAEQMGM